MSPVDQVLHILGQPGRVWCGIFAPRALQGLTVMLHGEMRLISQRLIGHFVGQINEMSVGRGALQRITVI